MKTISMNSNTRLFISILLSVEIFLLLLGIEIHHNNTLSKALVERRINKTVVGDLDFFLMWRFKILTLKDK
jgi:hypothetical protein